MPELTEAAFDFFEVMEKRNVNLDYIAKNLQQLQEQYPEQWIALDINCHGQPQIYLHHSRTELLKILEQLPDKQGDYFCINSPKYPEICGDFIVEAVRMS